MTQFGGYRMDQMIVVSAVGSDTPAAVENLTRVILECGGNIKESRISALGSEIAMLLLLTGNWHTMNRLEHELKKHAEANTLALDIKRTEPKQYSKELLPYAVDVVGLDQPGIVNHLSSFFAARRVSISDVTTRTYPATGTGTPMCSVQMLINVPASVHLSGLREEFMELCDRLNVDAIMEPVKHP
jgi:glycine cleavage system transcriptional repressor